MADYWLTFRIDDAGHPERYDALIEAVNASGSGFWEGPTSFIAMRSALSIDALGSKLKAAIDVLDDLILIREI